MHLVKFYQKTKERKKNKLENGTKWKKYIQNKPNENQAFDIRKS